LSNDEEPLLFSFFSFLSHSIPSDIQHHEHHKSSESWACRCLDEIMFAIQSAHFNDFSKRFAMISFIIETIADGKFISGEIFVIAQI
jgi:hypothetical protein